MRQDGRERDDDQGRGWSHPPHQTGGHDQPQAPGQRQPGAGSLRAGQGDAHQDPRAGRSAAHLVHAQEPLGGGKTVD